MHEHSNHDSIRHRWPAALVDDEEIAFFMADALENGDAAYIAKALGVVSRAKGLFVSVVTRHIWP
jgi:probable addiction module antidote protein